MKKTAESVLKSARENNEPVLILRAKDKCALSAINQYIRTCTINKCDFKHIEELILIEQDFEYFKKNNPDKMKIPD
jgi:hypothetical protein